jgi:hypothetical protein
MKQNRTVSERSVLLVSFAKKEFHMSELSSDSKKAKQVSNRRKGILLHVGSSINTFACN